MHALRLDIWQESLQTICAQGHEYKNNGLDIRSSVIINLRWPSSKKRMASKIDWSYIALPSTRTDLVTSTRQFQEKGFDFVTALSSAAQISLPKSISPTRVRSWNNNVELRKARSRVLIAHQKFGKYSSQHSAALE